MHLLFFFLLLFVACSNSDCLVCNEEKVVANGEEFEYCVTQAPEKDSLEVACDTIKSYIPLDDSEYPYVGLPRVVIVTENQQAIKDKESEIPAKMQIWGKTSPESSIMNLTIRGRGNTTWGYPKKPYAIKFEKKEQLFGLPYAKKWVLLANYRDRTSMRNAVAFELARKTSLEWTPSGVFVELFMNGKYLGCYYICEKIEIKKNRLNLSDDAYLLEFDTHYDADFKFRTTYNNLPVNVKNPKDMDSLSFKYIQSYIDSVEFVLQKDADDLEYSNYLNQESFADYMIVYAMADNGEPQNPKSVFMYKENGKMLTAGPVWDFDYWTFRIDHCGFSNWHSIIFKNLTQKKMFKRVLVDRWDADKLGFAEIFHYIDSLAIYISDADKRNAKLWPINVNVHLVGDEKVSFEDAIEMLKKDLYKKLDELDSIINNYRT